MGAGLATTLTFTISMTTLLVLFVRDGSRPSLSRLFVPQPEDWKRIKRIAGRALGRDGGQA
jgi:Na+-driven multidrug efflux pump